MDLRVGLLDLLRLAYSEEQTFVEKLLDKTRCHWDIRPMVSEGRDSARGSMEGAHGTRACGSGKDQGHILNNKY